MRYAYFPHFIADMHERGGSDIPAAVTSAFGMLIDRYANDVGASGTIIPQPGKELQRLRYEIMEPDLDKKAAEFGLLFGWYTEGSDAYYLNSTSSTLTGSINNYTAGVGIYAAANLTNSMITSQAWDPDAPYYFISEADYNPRTANNITAMPGIVVQLFENKSVSGKIMWERRVATGYVCILSTMETAANRPEVVAKIEEIRKHNIDKGKTVSSSDMIPIKYHSPRPVWFTEDREWPVIDLDMEYTNQQGNNLSPRDMTGITMYDGTKALQRVAPGTGFNSGDFVPVKGTGSRDRQFFKVTYNWQSVIADERIRPYAYLIEGPYANELVTRMMLAGIEVKRLAQDVRIDVEGWSYNARTLTGAALDFGGPVVDTTDQASGGWRNRHVTILPRPDREFKKDTFVVYLAQRMCNLIPMYLEPDMPWNVGSVIFLTNMSAALGGPSNGWLSPQLIGMEMPAYRYLKEVDLPTYDVDHYHPLVSKGAVARFYSYHTQESQKEAAEKVANQFGINLSATTAKVFDYDIQVHTRTDSLVNGRFDITLPTSSKASKYFILKKDGAYEPMSLTPRKTAGWNVGTVVVANHGLAPWTVDVDSNGRPIVNATGAARTVFVALRDWDDLHGVRIVEVLGSPTESIFKDGKLPLNAVETQNGIEYTQMFTGKSVLLSNSMLDEWQITDVTPRNGSHWRAELTNGEVIVTFYGNSYNQTVKTILTKNGSSETMELEIKFSGEKDADGTGCNAGFATLFALFALIPLLPGRKY
jgi:hypothetical protein